MGGPPPYRAGSRSVGESPKIGEAQIGPHDARWLPLATNTDQSVTSRATGFGLSRSCSWGFTKDTRYSHFFHLKNSQVTSDDRPIPPRAA